MKKSLFLFNCNSKNKDDSKFDLIKNNYCLSNIENIHHYDENDIREVLNENDLLKNNHQLLIDNKLYIPFLFKKLFSSLDDNEYLIYSKHNIIFTKENINNHFNNDITVFSNNNLINRVIPYYFLTFYQDDTLLKKNKKYLPKNIPSTDWICIKKNEKNMHLVNEWYSLSLFFIQKNITKAPPNLSINVCDYILSLLLIKNYETYISNENWNNNVIEKSSYFKIIENFYNHKNPTLYLHTYIDKYNFSVRNIELTLKNILNQNYFPIKHIICFSEKIFYQESKKIIDSYSNKITTHLLFLPKNIEKTFENANNLMNQLIFEKNSFLTWAFPNYNFNNSYYLDVINDMLTNERKVTYSKLDFQNNVNNLLFLESSYYISLKNKLFFEKNKISIFDFIEEQTNLNKHTYNDSTISFSINNESSIDVNIDSDDDDIEKKDLYIFHFGKEQTITALNIIEKKLNKKENHVFDQWEMTLLDNLTDYFNLKNGYTEDIPVFDDKNRKNVALINICLPHELPFKLINERNDIYKIIYTKESPNIRHTQQWEANFLNLFDHILTYWNPLLSSNNSKVSYCPFIHRLDLDNEIHNNLLLNNTSFEKNIIMVLECRELSGNYKISNINLCCLDPMRKIFASHLKNLTVVGPGWKDFLGENSNVKIIDNKKGRWDDKTVIEHLENYTFNLVLENCNADGYVSEKIFDSFMAGCIPIYYGNINKDLLHIPEDMYINLKNFDNVDELNKFLDDLSENDIRKYKNAIFSQRKEVLKNVSTRVFAEKVNNAYKLSEI